MRSQRCGKREAVVLKRAWRQIVGAGLEPVTLDALARLGQAQSEFLKIMAQPGARSSRRRW